VESERAVPYPDVAHWVCVARMDCGKIATALSQAELQGLQPRQGFKEDFIHPFIFFNIFNARILIAIFI
jgi:hypothetical protein